jgi:hypothetical protein
MNQKLMMTASILALVLSIVILVRISIVKNSFESTVQSSLKTSEGYDEKFITMVDRLENVLTTQASFGYSGGKDPMTGNRREVAKTASEAPAPTEAMPNPQAPKATPVRPAAPPLPPPDAMKLTAIIGDATDRHQTAIVLDGERSYSVDVGDVVSGRRITRITNEGIFMESSTQTFYYDIYGKRQIRNKTNVQSPVRPAGR